MVELHWEEIFEYELNAWMRDASTWPSNRTLTLFQQWFDVEFASMVFDLCEEPLET